MITLSAPLPIANGFRFYREEQFFLSLPHVMRPRISAAMALAHARADLQNGRTQYPDRADAYRAPQPDALADMTHERWSRMRPAERDVVRDLSDLSPWLFGLEGCRVEITYADGERKRANVGHSTGWRPCHILLHNRASSGGMPPLGEIVAVRMIDGRERQSCPKGINRPKPRHAHGAY